MMHMPSTNIHTHIYIYRYSTQKFRKMRILRNSAQWAATIDQARGEAQARVAAILGILWRLQQYSSVSVFVGVYRCVCVLPKITVAACECIELDLST